MDGSAPLIQLARLLIVSANTARQIAELKPNKVAEIHRIAHQIEELAEQYRKIGEADLNVIAIHSRRKN